MQAEDRQVDRGIGLHGVRRVEVPAGVGRAPGGEPGAVEHDPTEQEHPVREGVQARERHVGGTDHQRQDEVPEAGEDRDDDEENHRQAVHREELVEGVAADDVGGLGRDQLRADQERADAAEHEEEQARRDVEDADALVVSRDEPGRESSAVPRQRVHALGADGHYSVASGVLACELEQCLDLLVGPPAPDGRHLVAAVAHQLGESLRVRRAGGCPRATARSAAAPRGCGTSRTPRRSTRGRCWRRAVRSSSYSSTGTATTVSDMALCWMPQNSPQVPAYSPASSARNHVWLTTPGMASILPPSARNHHEWMTSWSGAVTSSSTVRSTGTTSVSYVTEPSGYWNSQ